jgi:hypothetical protein
MKILKGRFSMRRFIPANKFIYDLSIVSGIVLGAMAMLGNFEPRYVCTFGAAAATMHAYYAGFALLALGIGGMYWHKRQQAKSQMHDAPVQEISATGEIH